MKIGKAYAVGFGILMATAASIGFINLSPINEDLLQTMVNEAGALQATIDAAPAGPIKDTLSRQKSLVSNGISTLVNARNCGELKTAEPTMRSGIYRLFPFPGRKINLADGEKEVRQPFIYYCDFSQPFPYAGRGILISGSLQGPNLGITESLLSTVGNVAVSGVETSTPALFKFREPSELTMALIASRNNDVVRYKDSGRIVVRNSTNVGYLMGADSPDLLGLGNPAWIKSDNSAHVLQLFESVPGATTVRTLKNFQSNSCLSFPRAGELNPRQFHCQTANLVNHQLLPVGNELFKFRHPLSNRCLTSESTSVGENARVSYESCITIPAIPDNQLWRRRSIFRGVDIWQTRFGNKCLDLLDAKLLNKSTLVAKPCALNTVSQRWQDSARLLGIYARNISTSNPTWSDWSPVTPPNFYSFSSPALTLFNGIPHFITTDSKHVRVYFYVESTGVWIEFIRTPMPFNSTVPVSVAISQIDIGDSSPALAISVRRYSSQTFVAVYSRSRMLSNWVEIDTGPFTGSPVDYDFAGIARSNGQIGGMEIDFKVIGMLAVRRLHFKINSIVAIGKCSHLVYLKNNPGITPKSYAAAKAHFDSTGKGLGLCEPYELRCSVVEYLKRRPDVLADPVYGKDPVSHFERIGFEQSMCRPEIPTCTSQKYYLDHPEILNDPIYSRDPVGHFLRNYGMVPVTPETCNPTFTKRCTPTEYRSIRGIAANILSDWLNNGIMNSNACEPSLPERCKTNPYSCLGVSASPQFVTQGMLDRINAIQVPILSGNHCRTVTHSYYNGSCRIGDSSPSCGWQYYTTQECTSWTNIVYKNQINYCNSILNSTTKCNDLIIYAAQKVVEDRATCLAPSEDVRVGSRIPDCLWDLDNLANIIWRYSR